MFRIIFHMNPTAGNIFDCCFNPMRSLGEFKRVSVYFSNHTPAQNFGTIKVATIEFQRATSRREDHLALFHVHNTYLLHQIHRRDPQPLCTLCGAIIPKELRGTKRPSQRGPSDTQAVPCVGCDWLCRVICRFVLVSGRRQGEIKAVIKHWRAAP